MRDTAGKLPEGFLLAELEEFLLGALALGDVAENEHGAEDLLVLVADGRGGPGDGEFQAAGGAQQHVAGLRQMTRFAFGECAHDGVAHVFAHGSLQESDVVVEREAEQRFALDAQ